MRGRGVKGSKEWTGQSGECHRERKPRNTFPTVTFKSKIKMWISQCHPAHSDTQASLGGGVQDPQITPRAEAEERSRHVHPWLKNTAVP